MLHTASSKAVKSVTNVICEALRADVGISGVTKFRIGRFTTFINEVVKVLKSTENSMIAELQSRLSAKMAICIETKIEPVLNFEKKVNGNNSPKVRFKCVDPK